MKNITEYESVKEHSAIKNKDSLIFDILAARDKITAKNTDKLVQEILIVNDEIKQAPDKNCKLILDLLVKKNFKYTNEIISDTDNREFVQEIMSKQTSADNQKLIDELFEIQRLKNPPKDNEKLIRELLAASNLGPVTKDNNKLIQGILTGRNTAAGNELEVSKSDNVIKAETEVHKTASEIKAEQLFPKSIETVDIEQGSSELTAAVQSEMKTAVNITVLEPPNETLSKQTEKLSDTNTITNGKKKKEKEIHDVLLEPLGDRRLLSNVPDAEAIRTNVDRRGKNVVEDFAGNAAAYIKVKQSGNRYHANYKVNVICSMKKGGKKRFQVNSSDVSTTGILLKIESEAQLETLQNAKKIRLKFEITPGSMPEGYEMKVNLLANIVRTQKTTDGILFCGFEFKEVLSQYANRKRGRYFITIASIILLFISLFVILMRAESIIYFKFNKYLYLYSIIAAAFLLSRYLFGAMYKPMPINSEFTPGVTIIIPCFNEEEWIERTISSCLNQDYPIDKLEVIVVDDCSNDNSVEVIQKTIDKFYNEAERFKTKERLHYVVQEKNAGKRDALARGALMAKHDLIVFVDSDSFLDPFAIRNLVQPFQDPKMGGVAGRTDVANTYTNALTKMQSVRYYIAFRIMKSAEAYFDAVTCLSGPLSCYKKEIILENMDAWLNQRFLGQKATFGDDRAMTNFVLKHHRTAYQDSAICSTIVPNKYKVFLKQQMRWKRSWLRESIIAGKYIWRKEPFTSLFFYIGLIVPIAAPVVVIYNLLYVPIVNRVFPTTFLIGLLMMSMLMSFAQLFYRKSSTWLFGLLFCLFYEGVLLWQMPVAWFTFWKSTWGTRMTPEDIKAEARKAEKLFKKKPKKKGQKDILSENEI